MLKNLGMIQNLESAFRLQLNGMRQCFNFGGMDGYEVISLLKMVKTNYCWFKMKVHFLEAYPLPNSLGNKILLYKMSQAVKMGEQYRVLVLPVLSHQDPA